MNVSVTICSAAPINITFFEIALVLKRLPTPAIKHHLLLGRHVRLNIYITLFINKQSARLLLFNDRTLLFFFHCPWEDSRRLTNV